MKDKNEKLREKVCRALDITPDVFPKETLVEIRGRGAVTVRGGGAIRVYNDDIIKLAIRGGSLAIRGEGLCCSSYCRGSVTVEGRVSSVSFEGVVE